MDCTYTFLDLLRVGVSPEMVRSAFLQTVGLLGPVLTQACLERVRVSFHFAFPNRKRSGAFGADFLVHRTHLSFPSGCIVLYIPEHVNTFLVILHSYFSQKSPVPFGASAKNRARTRYLW